MSADHVGSAAAGGAAAGGHAPALAFLGAPEAVGAEVGDRGRKRAADEIAARPRRGAGIAAAATGGGVGAVGGRRFAEDEHDRHERARWMRTAGSMSAYERHQRYINNYVLWYGDGAAERAAQAAAVPPARNDYDVLRDHHKFVWTDADLAEMDWEKEQAHKYYEKLFKEYAVADLSQHKSGRIALRWRVESEVLEGKGQFVCGEVSCGEREGLASYEVNFGYVEHCVKRNVLVKLRMCPRCAEKLSRGRRAAPVVDPLAEGGDDTVDSADTSEGDDDGGAHAARGSGSSRRSRAKKKKRRKDNSMRKKKSKKKASRADRER